MPASMRVAAAVGLFVVAGYLLLGPLLSGYKANTASGRLISELLNVAGLVLVVVGVRLVSRKADLVRVSCRVLGGDLLARGLAMVIFSLAGQRHGSWVLPTAVAMIVGGGVLVLVPLFVCAANRGRPSQMDSRPPVR
jgi:hypothetical protein